MDTVYARQQMVEQQVRAWEVYDRTILDVLSAVAREQFVPPAFRSFAFADTDIPLGHGQKMMTPTLEGRMLQALGLTQDERVLEIGTGSGFVTACLAKLAASVCSIDIFDDFVTNAARKLELAQIDNVQLVCMDACRALPEGDFDAIAVTGSLPRFDERYLSVLRPGGRLFVIVGESPVQEAKLIQRGTDEDWTDTALFETDIAALLNSDIPTTFTF
jgi:protein-L-isoaspartate(D-aspartate) O-methyltransferase